MSFLPGKNVEEADEQTFRQGEQRKTAHQAFGKTV
jgi:hypothetical protein